MQNLFSYWKWQFEKKKKVCRLSQNHSGAGEAQRQPMRKLATPEVLFAAFVVVSVIAGLSLSALEGERERSAGLDARLLVSFFSTIPLLIAAAIAERREVRKASEGTQQSSKGSAFLTPLRLFLFGVDFLAEIKRMVSARYKQTTAIIRPTAS